MFAGVKGLLELNTLQHSYRDNLIWASTRSRTNGCHRRRMLDARTTTSTYTTSEAWAHGRTPHIGIARDLGRPCVRRRTPCLRKLYCDGRAKRRLFLTRMPKSCFFLMTTSDDVRSPTYRSTRSAAPPTARVGT